MTHSARRGLAKGRKDARLQLLQRAVARDGAMHVRAAADLLGVSEMTVRRDLRDGSGSLQFLGGHIVLSQEVVRRAPYDLSAAADINQPAKRAACAACLPLVRAEDTLFVDCGTTLPHLVALLPDDMELTVICYALNIADMVVRKPNIRLVLLGGAYHPPTASFYPTEEDKTLEAYAITRAFMSAAGVDERLGVSCTTFREAALKRAAMARAQSRVLVADRSKFGQVQAASFAALTDFEHIASESGLSRP